MSGPPKENWRCDVCGLGYPCACQTASPSAPVRDGEGGTPDGGDFAFWYALDHINDAPRPWSDAAVGLLVRTNLRALAALRSQLAAAERELDEWREREARVCPEDVGFAEYIPVLQRRLAAAEAERDAARADAAKLRDAIFEFATDADNLMKGPASYERGRALARLVGQLLEPAQAGGVSRG